MSRPRIKHYQTWASMVGGEHSRKELFEQLVNSYSEHLHMILRQYRTLIIFDGWVLDSEAYQ